MGEFRTIKAAEVKIDSLRRDNEILRKSLADARAEALKANNEKAQEIARFASIDVEAIALSECYDVLDRLSGFYGPWVAAAREVPAETDARVVRIIAALSHRYGVTR